MHRQRTRARTREAAGVCAPEAKVKYAAAPASRSIMRRVTHASLLHCEPCYASARQGARRIYGGISAVIERYAPSSRYLFLPVGAGAPHRLSARLHSSPPLPVPPLLHIMGANSCQSRELASTCSENIERRTSEFINQSAIFDARSLASEQDVFEDTRFSRKYLQ